MLSGYVLHTSSSSSSSFTGLGHLLTRSGLTYPEVSSKVYHDSFCQLGSSISLPWVIHFEAFCLHVVSRVSCIPVICLKLVLFLIHLQFVHLFCNLSKCILLFFSCISSYLKVGLLYRPTAVSQKLSVSTIRVADCSEPSAHICNTKHSDFPETSHLHSKHQRNHKSKEMN